MNVKSQTIKNMRDEFDPIHPNSRVGWYQRELRPSRLQTLDKYENLSEEALTEVVKDILNKYDKSEEINESLVQYIDNIESNNEKYTKNRQYTTRGITGRKAEEIFKKMFEDRLIEDFEGNLIDTREDGCGYDFKIWNNPQYVFEVKGSIEEYTGIMFTDKEWHVAKALGEKYILVIVSNLCNEEPTIDI